MPRSVIFIIIMDESSCSRQIDDQTQWRENFVMDISLKENEKSSQFNVLTKSKYLELIVRVEIAEKRITEKKYAISTKKIETILWAKH